MVYKLVNLIPSPDIQTEISTDPYGYDRKWVAAQPLPYYPGFFERLGSACRVLWGRAIAVRYPEHGEFEDALFDKGWLIRRGYEVEAAGSRPDELRERG